ncbi:MAG: glycosyltransferase family 39 protein [bacterium]
MGKRKKKIKKINQKTQKAIIKDSLRKRLFKKENYIIVGILILAFILRLIHLFQMQSNYPEFYSPNPGTDMGMYDKAAMEILNGNPIKGPFYYNPLYYYFLALNYYLFGHNLFTIRLIQALLGIVTGLVTYLIAKKIFNEKVAIISLLLYALCGYLIYYEGVLLSISLTTFLCVTAVWFFLQARERKSNKRFITGGILLGLAALSQPNTILLLPFVLLWILLELKEEVIKRRLQRCAIVLLACFVAISPITIKNYIDSGKFVLISTSGSFNFWLGNHEHSLGYFSSYEDLISLEKKIKEEGEKFYFKDVLRFIKEKPIDYLWFVGKKIYLFWGKWDVPHQVWYFQGRLFSPLLKHPFIFNFDIIAILGLGGILFSVKRFSRKTLLLYLFILGYSFSVITMLIHGRYRAPIVPFLIIYGGFLCVNWWENLKEKKYWNLFYSFIVLSVLILFINMDKIICITNPKGIYFEKDDRVIIKDNDDRYEDRLITLDSTSSRLKKEFIIDKDISKFNKACITWYFGGEKGEVIFNINGYDTQPINFNSLSFFQTMRAQFNSNILKRGLNSIIIRTTQDSTKIKMPVDSYYNYGRSYLAHDGIHWQKINGEYIIQLELIKD